MTAASEPAPGSAGVLLVDKPKGPGSHDLVRWVRGRTKCRAVGHCGTLDPEATGLLVICVGPATKLAPMLTATHKTYRARFDLGRATDTADGAGTVIDERVPTADALDGAARTLRGMVGDLELAPPAYSAIRVDGQRAHRLARAKDGTPPRMEPRAMQLHSVTELQIHGTTIEAVLSVSKGTYIRSLAVELGRRVDTPAHLGALRRLACGDLDVSDPRCVAGFETEALEPGRSGKPRWRIEWGPKGEDVGQRLHTHLLSPSQALPGLPRVLADGDQARAALARLITGQRLSPDTEPGLSILPDGSREDDQFCLEGAGEPLWVLVRLERGPRGLRLAPARVLRL